MLGSPVRCLPSLPFRSYLQNSEQSEFPYNFYFLSTSHTHTDLWDLWLFGVGVEARVSHLLAQTELPILLLLLSTDLTPFHPQLNSCFFSHFVICSADSLALIWPLLLPLVRDPILSCYAFFFVAVSMILLSFGCFIYICFVSALICVWMNLKIFRFWIIDLSFFLFCFVVGGWVAGCIFASGTAGI